MWLGGVGLVGFCFALLCWFGCVSVVCFELVCVGC